MKISILSTRAKQKSFVIIVVLALWSTTNCSKTSSVEINLQQQSISYSTKETPVNATIELPEDLQNLAVDELSVIMESESGNYKGIPGQIVKSENGQYKLWWILPEINEGEEKLWTVKIEKKTEEVKPEFHWKDTPDKYLDLYYDDRQVFRYEYELDDNLDKEKTLTAKNRAFYHIYDLQGNNKITNGPEEGVWSHHRGIMIGWRKVRFQDQELSFWGMEDLTVQKHVKFVQNLAGPVLARTVALIHWNDSTGATIIEEVRQATIYKQSPPDLLLMDFKSTLRPVIGAVSLDGDPEHGGVQYRAHNDVAEGAPGAVKPTYFFHQDDIDPHEDFNLPWVAMSYGLNNKMYSILQMDHPDNPNPTIWSAYRDYARFGAFFRKDLEENDSLVINYRFWMSEDTMPERVVLDEKYEAFIDPVEISNKE